MAKDLVPGGRADNKPDSDFDPAQLAKGQKVEREHTDSDALAREIAKDHLTELSDYYDRLEKMEKTSTVETTYKGYTIKYVPHPGDWSKVAQVKVFYKGKVVGQMGMSGMSEDQQQFMRDRYRSKSKTLNFAHINWAEIEPEHRGKGIYKEMLAVAVKGVKSQGSDGVSTIAQTGDSRKVWDSIDNKVVHDPEPGAAQSTTTLSEPPQHRHVGKIMKKKALEEVSIDTWLTVEPVRKSQDFASVFRLPADGAYIDHGGKLRIKFQTTKQFSDFDDALAEGETSPIVRYQFSLDGKMYKGEGNAVLYQDEIILKDLGKSEMKQIMKGGDGRYAKLVKALSEIEQKLAGAKPQPAGGHGDLHVFKFPDGKFYVFHKKELQNADKLNMELVDYAKKYNYQPHNTMYEALHLPEPKEAAALSPKDFKKGDKVEDPKKGTGTVSYVSHDQISVEWDHPGQKLLGAEPIPAGKLKGIKKVAMPPDSDHKLEAIADYLENGYEHDGDSEAIYHLQHEFGLHHDVAKKLLDEWQSKMIGPQRPMHMNLTKNLVPWIANIVHKQAGKENIKHNDKLFGTLLKPGDKIKIENVMTGGSPVAETVEKYDGLEYQFKGKPSPHDRLGHSGFSVESPKEFTIYMNREPHLKVTKVGSVPTVRIGSVNVKVSDLIAEYKKLGSDDAAVKKLAEKYKVDVKALGKALEHTATKTAAHGYVLFEMPTTHAAEELEAEMLDNHGAYKVDSSEVYLQGKKIGVTEAAFKRGPTGMNLQNAVSARGGKKIAARPEAGSDEEKARAGTGGPLPDPEIKSMADEYFILPKEFLKAEGKMLFIHKHGNLDSVLQGMDLLARAKCVKVVNKSLLVVYCPAKKLPEGHVFVGMVGLKAGVANAYVHKYDDNGYAYIGCMGNQLLK